MVCTDFSHDKKIDDVIKRSELTLLVLQVRKEYKDKE